MFNFHRENFRGGGCGTQPFSPFKNPAIGNMEPIQPILKNEQNFDCLQDSKEVISRTTQNQGGRRPVNIGWALCSNNDVTKSMTSLLLLCLAKILVGHVLFPKIVNPSLAGISKSKQLEVYREDWLAVNFLGLSWLKPTNPAQNCARDIAKLPA